MKRGKLIGKNYSQKGEWLIRFSSLLYILLTAALVAELINFHPLSSMSIETNAAPKFTMEAN